MLGYIKRCISTSTREVTDLLYSVLVRQLLEYFFQVQAPHFSRDIDKLKSVQRQTIRIERGIQIMLCQVKGTRKFLAQRKLELGRCDGEDDVAPFKSSKVIIWKRYQKLSSYPQREELGSFIGTCRLDVREYFLKIRAIQKLFYPIVVPFIRDF